MLNPYFTSLKREYIFPIIEQKLEKLRQTSSILPLNLGIGDIARPLSPCIAQAIIDATQEMTRPDGIHGYGPHNGYSFLREAIVAQELAHLGITADEIFISDGINSDAVNMQELFSTQCSVLLLDPTYPAYLDAALLSGKSQIHFVPCLEATGFCPPPPDLHADLIYLCSPSNPTGVAMTRLDLQAWVDYALKEKAILLFDHAYEAFITSADVPRSIFELPGAKNCAIEFHSFSKKAGFTGLRCAYTVIPKTVTALLEGKETSLHSLWNRRQAAKFNGVAYPIQKGALAFYSPEGKAQTRSQVEGYLKEAKKLKTGIEKLGMRCYGGVDSPYLWCKVPSGRDSWGFFDHLLHRCHLISIPGCGFGKSGEGYIRLSAFILPETTDLALERLQNI